MQQEQGRGEGVECANCIRAAGGLGGNFTLLKPLTPCGKGVSEELLTLSGGQFSPVTDQYLHKTE